MTTPSPYIDVQKLCMKYGAVTALNDLSFSLVKGEMLGIVGSDGAGKSTLLRLIAGMIKPLSGEISIDGKPAAKHRLWVKSTIGYMPQRFGLYEDLTVGENFDFFMDIFQVSGNERDKRRHRYLGFSNLLPFMERPAGKLSGGMKQKLGLACVLVHQPQILVLDEPTNGVDPVSRKEFWDILFQMKQQGMTILIATSYLDEGEQCDQLMFMHQGQSLAAGPPQEVRQHFASLEDALIHRILEKEGAYEHAGFYY